MRALTVRQPWAWAIVHARPPKDVENRTRNVAGAYRGPVAIHAAARYADDWSAAAWAVEQITGEAIPPFDCGHGSEVLGAFIGVVDLINAHPSPPGSRCCTAWAQAGAHHLVLANPRPLAVPIPCRGRLGLWTPPPDVVEQLMKAYVPPAPRFEPLPDPVVPTNG